MEFEIVQHLATLNPESEGWKLELNLVSWFGKDPSLDLRRWSDDHTKMSKGIALSKGELEVLAQFVKDGGLSHV